MIPVLFFIILVSGSMPSAFVGNFCIADDNFENGWNCEGKMFVPETEDKFRKIIEAHGREWTGYNAGLYVSMYLDDVHQSTDIFFNPEMLWSDYTPLLGCNLIWHEILHAQGYEEGELPLTDRDCFGIKRSTFNLNF